MKGRLFAIILAACFCCYAPSSARADTGTYEIAAYKVNLVPQEDGWTEITYYQLWKVTGGHIPWITMGTANDHFKILPGRTRGNIRNIDPQNQGSWSGIRITLDKDYRAGETFEVEFTVLQGGLFFAAPAGYRMDFVPGWYDRAPIGMLTVELAFFTDLKTISVRPEPDQSETRRLLWERVGLKPGSKLRISVTLPKESFPGKIRVGQTPVAGSRRTGRSSREFIPLFIIIGVLVLVVTIVLIGVSRNRRSRYGGGGLMGIGSTHYHGSGCVVSCACACVACACACACAGGGGAGCDRKLTLRCPLCADCQNTDCVVIRGAAAPDPQHDGGHHDTDGRTLLYPG